MRNARQSPLRRNAERQRLPARCRSVFPAALFRSPGRSRRAVSAARSTCSCATTVSRTLRPALGKQLQMNRVRRCRDNPTLLRAVKTRIGASNWQSASKIWCIAALRRAAARRIGRVAIHPVLGDVDVKAAQIDGAKLIERVINLVEFVGRIGRADNPRSPAASRSRIQRSTRVNSARSCVS